MVSFRPSISQEVPVGAAGRTSRCVCVCVRERDQCIERMWWEGIIFATGNFISSDPFYAYTFKLVIA